MKSTLLLLLSLGLVLLTTPAHANLCDSVKDRVTTGDTKGNDIAKVTASAGNNADKQTLKSRDLEPKVIRGHYNFFGTVVTQLKYVYVLSKKDGVWTMIIPYRPIINDVVPNRVDFNSTHAG